MISRDPEDGRIIINLGSKESIWFPIRCEIARAVPHVIGILHFLESVVLIPTLAVLILPVCFLFWARLIRRERAAAWIIRVEGWSGVKGPVSLVDALDEWGPF